MGMILISSNDTNIPLLKKMMVGRRYFPFAIGPFSGLTFVHLQVQGGPKSQLKVGAHNIPVSSRYVKKKSAFGECFFLVKRHNFYTLGRSRYCNFPYISAITRELPMNRAIFSGYLEHHPL